MSKVIRTGQVAAAGGVVTLGRAEEGLFYDAEAEAKSEEPRIDLTALMATRVDEVRTQLDASWESKLRQEHETTRAAGERQLEETREQHQAEVEKISQERYDEGHQDGVASKDAESTEAVQRMAALHDALKAERSQVLLDAENVVVDLALALARRVIRVEPVADPRIVARTAREALRHLSERSNLLLKVHPEDLGIARRFAAAWVDRVDADAILRVQTSGHVDRGGCMLEGPEENVDARLMTQLETLHEALRDGLMNQHQADVGHETAVPESANEEASDAAEVGYTDAATAGTDEPAGDAE